MAEFTIHNVRFYDFEPKAIQCMTYEDDSHRLALSRADGTIEIWNCQDKLFLQFVLPGDSEASVEGLAWCDGRLFSVGLHGFLLEYDFTLFTVKSRTAVTGGPTWCVALSPDKQKLATGTEEGYVCLFDVGGDGVVYNKTLEKQEGRILSICWHSSGDYIVTGSINCVRLWSLKDGRVTRCSFVHSKREEIIVWCVAILDNMTIISGDSRGTVCFWNATLGTQTHSVQSHRASILCLAVGSDQSYVIVAGVDPTITHVSLTQTGGKVGKKTCWLPTVKLRVHTHDVRAIVLSKEGTLYSGGVDTILAASSYPPKRVTKTPAPLYPGHISLGRQSEFILLRYKERLELWRLGRPREDTEPLGNFLAVAEDRVKLLELQCNEGDSIDWCALSPEGLWIAYIVKQTLKIFQFFPPTIDRQVSVRRVRALSKEIESSRQVMWLAEERLASVTTKGTIQFISISDMEANVESVLVPRAPIQSMVCNADGTLLVVVDVNYGITSYDLENGQETILPTYSSPVVTVGINPFTRDIVVCYADLMIKEYSLADKRYTLFFRDFLKKSSKLRKHAASAIRNISFDTEDGNLIFFHDDSSIMVLDKKVRNSKGESVPPSKFMRNDNRHKFDNTVSNVSGKYSFVPRTHQILYFSHVKDKTLVSVEIDPVQLHDQLPPTLKVKKYGGT